MSSAMTRRSVGDLNVMFQPESIVMIGASSNPDRIGGRPLRYLREHHFQGRLYAVNPRHTEVMGIPCYPSVADLPHGIHLAIVALPADQVLASLKECVAVGIRSAVVFASGFAEFGPEGRAMQKAIGDLACRSGLRVLGPNTVGFRDQKAGVYATFGADVDSGILSGSLAVVTQSGGLGGYFGVALPRDAGIGVKYLIDTGNEADIRASDCIEWIAKDPDITVIGLIVEGCWDGARLISSCQAAASRGKTVVALKVGRSAMGSAAAAAHTGALASEERIWDAAFEAAHVVTARNEVEFFDVLNLLSVARRPTGRHLGVMTLSGGVAALALDAISTGDLEVPVVPAPPAAITGGGPAITQGNPLDCGGRAPNAVESIGKMLHYLLERSEIDAVFLWVAHLLKSPTLGPRLAAAIVSGSVNSEKPVYVSGMASAEVEMTLRRADIPLFAYPTRLLRALEIVSRPRIPANEVPPLEQVSGALRSVVSGTGARAMLTGLPLVEELVLPTVDAAEAAALTLGFPLVLKAEVPGLAHKSDRGFVCLDLRSVDAVHAAWHTLAESLARQGLDGSIVAQPQVSGIEAFLGYKRDPVFGPVLLLGSGGTMVESTDDVAALILPTNEDQVGAALARLRLSKPLAGLRGQPPADVAALIGTATTFGRTLANRVDVVEFDLNPVVVRPAGMGVVIVDAVAVVASANGDPGDADQG